MLQRLGRLRLPAPDAVASTCPSALVCAARQLVCDELNDREPAGALPRVGSCADYADALGHLTPAGAAEVGRRLGERYASQN